LYTALFYKKSQSR